MVKLLFFFIVLLHGLIHLMGFAKAFNYAEISQLTQPISKAAGALWGLTALLFGVAAGLFIFKQEKWWMWALPAVLLSQFLIFTSWQDAKFGTVANLIAVAGIVTGFGQWSFNRMAAGETEALLTQKKVAPVLVSQEKTAALPPIVQTWLRRSGVAGKPAVSTIRLEQTGEMRTTPDGKWMPVEAEQYFTVDPPGFVWLADVRMMPSVYLAGRDKYTDGRGHMLIKALSLVTVADAKGPETDQGTLLRFLGETVWFPSAILSDYIDWEPLDATSAKATMSWGGVTASGVFHFKENGDFQSFEADRYYDRNGTSTLERWYIEAKEWRDFDGVRLPAACEVTWKLEEGDFTWYRLEVTDVNYNLP